MKNLQLTTVIFFCCMHFGFSKVAYTHSTEDNFETITFNTNPQIALVVSGELNDTNGDGCGTIGETVTCTFTVSNPGDVSLTDVYLEDYMFQAPNPFVEIQLIEGDIDSDDELDVDETWVYEADYTITQDDVDLGRVDNQARVTAIASGSEVCVTSDIWGEDGNNWDPDGLIKDFSNVGYMQGNIPIPDWPVGVNVLDFGAVGDGVHDETEAFRDAIAACPDNTAVFVPNGRYKITDWIKVDNQDYFVLRGEDMYQTVLDFPNNLSEIRPENNYVHAGGGGFFYLNGGTHRSIENFTFEFREEQHLGHFSGTGANAIFTSNNLQDSWIRNIYIKNANLGIRVDGENVSVMNIVLDQYEFRPLRQNEMNMVGHYGITITGSTHCLVHNVLTTGQWAHDIGTHQAANNNVFSKVKSLVGGVITHKSASDNSNLYTEFDLGEKVRFYGDSRPGTIYWNIKAGKPISFPDESLNNVVVGYPTDQPISTSANHWHESTDAEFLCPQNLYLAQLDQAGKLLPDSELVLPPSWPAPNPSYSKPVEDTYVTPEESEPQGDELTMSSGTSQFRDFRPFLKFNLEQSVLNEVDQAILRIFKNQDGGSADMTVFRVDNDSWTEDNLTYNNKPADGIAISTTFVDTTSGWYEWDVTSFVNNELSGDKIVSIYIMNQELSTSAGGRWNTKENVYNHPELILTSGEDAPPQPPLPQDNPSNVTTVTDLSGTSIDNDIYTSTELCADVLNLSDFELDDIIVMPNPFTERLVITLPSKLENDEFKISLVDMLGRTVFMDNIILKDNKLLISNLSHLNNSIYFLNVESEDMDVNISRKIIKW